MLGCIHELFGLVGGELQRQFLAQALDLPFVHNEGVFLIMNHESGDRFWLKRQYGLGQVLVSPRAVAVMVIFCWENMALQM